MNQLLRKVFHRCQSENPKFFGVAFIVFAICATVAHAQQAQVPRIGFLVAGPASSVSSRVEAFRQGLRQLAYVEGKNIVVEYRYREGNLEIIPALAPELVKLKVD